MSAKASAATARETTTTSLWEEVSCNICGTNDYSVKYSGTTDQDMQKMLSSYSASGNFVSKERLVQCNTCSLIFTSPRLRKDLILKGYTESEDPTYVSQAEGRIKSFGMCLNAVEKFKKGGRVLDVGAAAGFFLKVAKDRGWETYGIEPSKYLSDYGNQSYGVNIQCGTLDRFESGKPMDVITLWDVLEHTFDPTDILKRCHKLLAKEGIVVINYPNIGNWMAKLAGRHYWFILSVHLWYFVPSTIEQLLEKTGFEVMSSAPHFQYLEFGYLIYRLEAYLPRLAKWMGKVAGALGMKKWLVPYFAAQTRVIAKKLESKVGGQ